MERGPLIIIINIDLCSLLDKEFKDHPGMAEVLIEHHDYVMECGVTVLIYLIRISSIFKKIWNYVELKFYGRDIDTRAVEPSTYINIRVFLYKNLGTKVFLVEEG